MDLLPAITWTNETRRLGDLIPWDGNPRTIDHESAERLESSLEVFGQIQPIAIDPDDEILDGHQRQKVWGMSEKYGPDTVVDVRLASRKLIEKERQRLAVYLHRGAVGDFDFDLMEDWNRNEMIVWGFTEEDLEFFGVANEGGDEFYSREIVPPAYEPSGALPEVADLYDDTKTRSLIEHINELVGLDESVRAFLRMAAQRHTILYFDEIAEFYAHADVEIQNLMEESALIILDFDRAIELGYVELTENIARMVGEEQGTPDGSQNGHG